MTIQLNSETDAEIILRIADLIEKGSAGMQQITGHYIARNGKSCCAIGAVYKAKGWIEETSKGWEVTVESYKLLRELGAQSWPRIPLPKGVDYSDGLPFATNDLNTGFVIDVVIFLNDTKYWTFNQIVEWLRQIASKTTS